MADIEHVIVTRRIYEGRILNLRVDTAQFPDGRTTTREVVEHSPSVVLVPLDDHGNVLLVRQYRLAVGHTLLELPAGGLNGQETPEVAADRELREETGYAAAHLERLGGYFASPGYCSEYLHLFLATGLHEAPLDADHDESIDVVRAPLREAVSLIERGEVQDAKSVAGLLWVLHRLGR
ncbi:MAG: NUDIX hydrolase [Chloroflexi bacterium]|nr:NUDIX hydrolase [Chloroflexota bacterium]